jgi:ATP-dependent DNA helicase RecQ
VNIEQALQTFGLSSFRPGQREVISEITAGHDCLCVMPTGGGKSLCFQLPTLLRPGLTIVVSPLIALMKDQVDGLARRGISAALLNSTLTNAEQSERLSDMAAGKYSLLYVAPERLRNPRFLDAVRATPVQLLAVDEAHCISEWGHDFRPDYARIGQFRRALGGVQTVALTATATERVRQDICEILQLRQPRQFVTGFARSNLHFGSLYCNGDRDKDNALLEFLSKERGAGIIYAATRKRCESLVEMLSKKTKLAVGAYHAGLTLDQRKFIQEQFMTGKLQAIVATNAFGMGIDKADLRYVVHYNIPGSIEAYYQEAGRAGRDGLPSQCVVLYSPQDRYIQEFFIENSNPPPELIAKVYELICDLNDDPIEKTAQEMKDLLGVPESAEAIGTALQIISRTGVIERLEVGGGLAMFRISNNLPTMIDMLPKDAEMRRKVLRLVERCVGDRRDEAVFVHPRWLMQESGLDRDTLGRHLNELRKLPGLEYVPPFRGRAIHVRQRGVPFEKLTIDFSALENRKRADFEKLDQVVDFAQSKRCRQLFILNYFGDPDAKPCQLCDRCHGYAGWPKFPDRLGDSPDDKSTLKTRGVSPVEDREKLDSLEPEDAPKLQYLLAAVIEAVSRHRGLFGKGLIADFLCGAKTEKLDRLRLTRIQGYGLLEGTRRKLVENLLEAMLSSELLESKMPSARRPTVAVSELGWKVARRESPAPDLVLAQLIPMKEAGKRYEPKSDSTPRAENPAKASNAASAIPSNNSRAGVSNESSNNPSKKPEPSEDWKWTLALADRGFPLVEMAAIRRKSIDQIIEDLIVAAQQGKQVPAQKLFSAETLQAMSRVRIDPPSAVNLPLFVQRPGLLRLAQAIRA